MKKRLYGARRIPTGQRFPLHSSWPTGSIASPTLPQTPLSTLPSLQDTAHHLGWLGLRGVVVTLIRNEYHIFRQLRPSQISRREDPIVGWPEDPDGHSQPGQQGVKAGAVSEVLPDRAQTREAYSRIHAPGRNQCPSQYTKEGLPDPLGTKERPPATET
jgi:hypothetical protein